MKFQVVAVADAVMGTFNRPFIVPTVGAAKRSFADEVNRKSDDNPMFKHASDFSLYHLGTWDDDTGKFDNFDVPLLLDKAVSLLVE